MNRENVVDGHVILCDVEKGRAERLHGSMPARKMDPVTYWMCAAGMGILEEKWIPRTPEDLVSALDEAGVTRGVVSSAKALYADDPEDLRAGNSAVREAVERYPDRLYPCFAVHPGFPGESVGQMKLFRGEGRREGPGMLCMCRGMEGWDEEGSVSLLQELLDEGWGIVRVQTFYSWEVEHLLSLAKRLPRMRFVFPGEWGEGMEALAACPNVYVDTSGCTSFLVETFGPIVEAFGSRVLFASGFPVWEISLVKSMVERVVDPELIPEVMGTGLLRLMEEGKGR